MSQGWEDADTLVQSSIHSESDSNLISNAMLNSFFDTPIPTTNDPAILTPPNDDPILNMGQHPLQSPLARNNNTEYETLRHFTEIQTRLSRLVQTIPGSDNVLAEIEDLYQVAEALSNVSETQDAATDEQKFGNVSVMLLSSCYMTLLHAYNSLVSKLSQELQQQQTNAAATNSKATSPPIPSSRDRRTPSISIGNVRLSIKREESIEINLYLAIYTLRHIRQKTQQFTSSAMAVMAKTGQCEPRPQSSGIWPPDLNGGRGTTLSDRAKEAMAGVRRNEESLFARLGNSGPSFS